MPKQTNEVVIRAATGADWSALRELCRAASNLASWVMYDWERAAQRPQQQVYVAVNSCQGVVGCLVTQTLFDECEVQLVCVATAQQRRGIARRLLAQAEQQPGVLRLLLEVAADNHPARCCYANCGYRQYHLRPQYYDNGADALLLEKRIHD